MKHQATVKFDVEVSENHRASYTQVIIEQLENRLGATNVQVDISEYPRSAGSIEGHLVERTDWGNAVVSDEGTSFLPEMGVTHPWDQGLWIFPDDHPLAAIEREARRVHDEHASEPHRLAIKQQMLEMGNSTPEVEVEE